jgi:hypothetical protein
MLRYQFTSFLINDINITKIVIVNLHFMNGVTKSGYLNDCE